MGHDEFERIQPASLDISSPAASTTPPARVAAQPSPVALLLVALLLVAAAVVFVLPEFVGEPSAAPAESAAAANAAAGSGAAAPANAVSPWEKAQAERERGAAKTALDALLALQFELQERGAENWAPTEYAEAIASAHAGDEAYRTERFKEAEQHYLGGRDRMQTLLEGIDARLQAALATGDAALAAADEPAATAAFNSALAIDAANQHAQSGLQRAANIAPLNAAMASGASAEAAGDFDAAAVSYRQALAIDNTFAPAQQALTALQARRTQDQYGARLSGGYAALASGKLAPARTEFQAALKLKPGGAEAREGLQQVEFQLSQQRIGELLARGAKASQSEQWQAALDAYAAALTIDASLGPAREGKQVAETRLALDGALQRMVAEPERLNSPAALDASQKLLDSAAAIAVPGPRLLAQIDAGRKLLAELRTSVAVRLVSDNKTEVTVFRVGSLGSFDATTLDLLPGKYIAVGQRNGYRDVRIEFVVRAGLAPAPVSVQCSQKI
ncbi:MAG: hypothetical protein IPH83_14930 [Gammaproteobacteria bacterium]|nr:hypothetical protein [Gammaproteobacteria bacterium]